MNEDRFYLSDGGNLSNIENILSEKNYNVETIYFALPKNLNGNLKLSIKNFKNLLNQYNIKKVSMHGPFFDLSLSSMEEQIVQLTHKRYNQAVDIARELEIEQIVFHSQYNPQLRLESYKKRWLDSNFTYFSRLLDKTRNDNITFLMENMFEDDYFLILELLNMLNSERMGVCLDVGHVNVYGDETVLKWIKELAKHIKYLHLSDNKGLCDDHLALGEGTVDLPGIFSELDKQKIYPDFCIEMNNEKNHRASLKYLEKIL